MDDVARKIVSLGLPGVMLAVALGIAGGAGLAGAAAITASLAMLGGPLGMMGGIAVLGAATLIGDAVGSYGIEEVLVAVYKIHRSNGRTCRELCAEIQSLWISRDMQQRIIQRIDCDCT
jgi:hypothetical protein